MFKVIEYARMMVGTKAITTLSTGYLNALDYAKTRVQGADMTQMTDKNAPRVTIVHPPDVRRALLTQKSYTEGLRALYLYTAAHQDAVVAGIASGADADMAERVNDLLLPIVKGVGSERAYQCLTESLQTLGGSGFLQDYPIEQYIRDANRLAVRRHHRDPGAGLLLPQDCARPGQSAGARGQPDHGFPWQ
jgi:alkylation response protein AidB-like acyl-CoA dehydrogenase